jgi:hypothetical protein
MNLCCQELPAKSLAKWEEIRTLFKVDRNSLNFREVLKKTICPCIPYLGLFLGDLTFMEDGNPGMGGPNGSLINLQKRRMIADRIKWIQQYQQTGMNVLFHLLSIQVSISPFRSSFEAHFVCDLNVCFLNSLCASARSGRSRIPEAEAEGVR